MSFLLAFYLGIILICIVLAVALLGSLRAEAPFVPTGRRDMRLILEAAKIMPGETVYDLGSGDGRVVREAARLGARAVGFEQSRILILWSRFLNTMDRVTARHPASEHARSRLAYVQDVLVPRSGPRPASTPILKESTQAGLRVSSAGYPGDPAIDLGSATFIRGDYLKEDLGEADVIFCYLLPKAMEHLKEKFETELKPGTRIFSRAFKIPGWEPRQRLQFSKHSPPVYVYVR